MPQPAADAARLRRVRRIRPGAAPAHEDRPIAVERPVAVEINGAGYAVMMMTPADLDDFAYGFCLAERLIDTAADIDAVEVHDAGTGDVLRVFLRPALAGRVVERVRHRVSESTCGLCGVENLGQALRPLPRVTATARVSEVAIFAALAALPALQPLNTATGAAHAAALCDADGGVRLVREDIGRHCALDKLIGAMLRGGIGWHGGFAVLTSRCSYELVEKAALANCPMLVTLSLATTLAIDRAHEAGVRLIVLARPDAALEPDPPGT
jgi:FdhD protein